MNENLAGSNKFIFPIFISSFFNNCVFQDAFSSNHLLRQSNRGSIGPSESTQINLNTANPGHSKISLSELWSVEKQTIKVNKKKTTSREISPLASEHSVESNFEEEQLH